MIELRSPDMANTLLSFWGWAWGEGSDRVSCISGCPQAYCVMKDDLECNDFFFSCFCLLHTQLTLFLFSACSLETRTSSLFVCSSMAGDVHQLVECLPRCLKPGFSPWHYINKMWWCMSNPSTEEAVVGGSQVQGHPHLST